METKITKLPQSEIEIEDSIEVEKLNAHKAKALEKLGKEVKIDGFRQGHIPEKVLIDKIGEMALWNEMAEMALSDVYTVILAKNKINAIGNPEVTITKLIPNTPVEFKIKTAVMPKIELPDYKKIASGVNSKKEIEIKVEEKEIEDAITHIKKEKQRQETFSKDDENPKPTVGQDPKPAKVQSEEVKEIEQDPKPEVGQDEKTEKQTTETNKEKELPELTDDFVKTLGDFKNVREFKIKLKENIFKEKERLAKEKKRGEILEEILKQTKSEIPNIIVENELNKLVSQMKDDVSRMGLKFDKYLEHVKKTEEDLRKEWRTDAEKRSKNQLILNEIALKEKIIAPKEDVQQGVKNIMDNHKEAREENVRIYVEMVVTNDEVIKFLEKQRNS